MNNTTKHNDQLTTKQFEAMGEALKLAIAKCEKALLYGEDMNSSRYLLMKDAKDVLSNLYKEIEES